MTTYQFEIALIIGLASLLLWQYPSQLNKKIYCALITIQWIVLSGLRHTSVGNDTLAYKISFLKVMNTHWGKIFGRFIDVYFKDEGKDPGYRLFVKVLQIFIGENYQLFLIIIAFIFFIPLGVWIYKHSKEPCMSALIVAALFWEFFGVTGHRQTIATAIVIFGGYKIIRERKFWTFFLLCIVAGMIHKSAFYFLPFYFFAYKKITRRYLITLLLTIPVLFVFRNQIMSFLAEFTGYIMYGKGEKTGAYGFSIALVGIFIVALWRMKPVLRNNPEAIIYYNALFIAMIFMPLLFVNQNAMRIVQYYSFFIVLLVPEILCSFDGQERVICYSVASGTLLALFFKGTHYYKFFWQ